MTMEEIKGRQTGGFSRPNSCSRISSASAMSATTLKFKIFRIYMMMGVSCHFFE
ncbi:unnamed protein product [Caenorhabditis brenneri]